MNEIIVKLRISKRMTQLELSKVLGISPSMLGMIEQGRRKPNDNTKIKICKFFNVSLDYLMNI